MCRKRYLSGCLVLLLWVVGSVQGATLFHWKFDGVLGNEIVSDTDIASNVVATKFYDEGYDANTMDFKLLYGEPNPWWAVTGTSAEFQRDPGDNDPGVGFFVPDGGSNSAVDLSTLTACTIEAFVRPAEVEQMVIVRKYNSGSTGVYFIDTRPEGHSYHPGKGVFAVRLASSTLDTGDHNSLCHDYPYEPEEWYHVALVWDGAVMKFYVDGQQSQELGGRSDDGYEQGTGVSEVNFPGPIGDSDRALGIGCIVRDQMTDPMEPPSTGQFYYGRIDEVRFSDAALAPEDFLLNAPEPHAGLPSPKSQAEHLCPGQSLCWRPGAYAEFHDVYFGTDSSEVGSATTSSSVYMERLSADVNCYSPSLDLGKTYYWRIDEVNEANIDSPWKGMLWQFTTNDGNAYDPSPANGVTAVPIDSSLSWSAACLAVSHEIYIGTSYDDVYSATSSSYPNVDFSALGPNSYDPASDFDHFKWYYWRVDEVGGAGQRWKGQVWSFRSLSAIIDVNMVAWYPLDEREGETANDSSGYERHADVDGPDEGPAWDGNDGQWGGSLGFDDDTDVECPTSVLNKLSNGITVSLWLKDAYRSGSDNWVFEAAGSNDSTVRAAVVEEDTEYVVWRAGNDSNDELRWDLDKADPRRLEGWHHWAFVKNEAAGEISIYFDGFVEESNNLVAQTLIDVRGRQLRFGVGEGHGNDFIGKMDDIRVFDRGLTAGEVASIYRGGALELAWGPYPKDYGNDVPRDVVIGWRPGDYANQHDVYFGTSFDDVNDAGTANTSIYKGRQVLEANSYNPGGLNLEATYYWRIDEVNSLDPNLWKGNVWRFTVANFLIVDDMESYDAISGSGNEIFDTWDDGFINYTGSQIALEYTGGETVHGGRQSMKVQFDNAIGYYKYSEIDANTTGPVPGNLEIGSDWTIFDVKALTVFFYGTPGNDANQQMYAALEDGSSNIYVSNYGALGEDMNDIREAEWHQWDMALSDFEDNAVVLTDVSKVRIGFGDRDNPVVGGSGIVFFDDVRLYLPKCVPWIQKPQFDFSNDCIVDLTDLRMMAEDWLLTDIDVAPVTAPNAPVLHYAFEDSSGSSVTDSAG
ncbi:MAG: LamG domain-containing protein, partial [Planctomycetota bacterium]